MQRRQQAKELHNVLREIETLPTADTAQLIRQLHAETEARRIAAERARAERTEQIAPAERSRSPYTDHPHGERSIGF